MLTDGDYLFENEDDIPVVKSKANKLKARVQVSCCQVNIIDSV